MPLRRGKGLAMTAIHIEQGDFVLFDTDAYETFKDEYDRSCPAPG
jgi:hypothetical protein